MENDIQSFSRWKDELIQIAWKSIHSELDKIDFKLDLKKVSPELRLKRATFVTLKQRSSLRGCIGSLEAYQPLVLDIADNARKAAFQDSRFPPLKKEEADDTDLSISILSPLQERNVSSQDELIEMLDRERPGLVLRDGSHRATFLPSVWENVNSPEEFFLALCHKGGISPTHYHAGLQVFTYAVEEIE